MKTLHIPCNSYLRALSFSLAILSFSQFGVSAAPVVLQNATATFSQTESANFSAGKTIDGVINDNLGWAIAPNIGAQTAAYETAANVGFGGGSILTFSLIQNASWFGNRETLGRFRISITLDDRSQFADGLASGGDVTANWIVLDPFSFTSANGTTLTKQSDDSILASGAAPTFDTYTVQATTTLTGITGIRLEVLPDPSLPFNGPGREPGDGNFILSEFQVGITPVPEPSPVALSLLGLPLLAVFRSSRKITR